MEYFPIPLACLTPGSSIILGGLKRTKQVVRIHTRQCRYPEVLRQNSSLLNLTQPDTPSAGAAHILGAQWNVSSKEEKEHWHAEAKVSGYEWAGGCVGAPSRSFSLLQLKLPLNEEICPEVPARLGTWTPPNANCICLWIFL
eukprot:1103029-Pelagomonas_calceolata.AAC.2